MLQKYVVFYSTQCMLRAVSMNASWQDDILAAVRCHTGGAGSRGVVADAVRVLEESYVTKPSLQSSSSSEVVWERRALGRYYTLLLCGFLEWHERMGVVQAKEWKATVLAGFAGREAFLNQRRCLVWAGLDTTIIYLIGNYRGLPIRRLTFQLGAETAGGPCVGSRCLGESAAHGCARERNDISVGVGRFAAAIARSGEKIVAEWAGAEAAALRCQVAGSSQCPCEKSETA